MNATQKVEQKRLVMAMARAMKSRAAMPAKDEDSDRRVELASKALYDFHATIIQGAGHVRKASVAKRGRGKAKADGDPPKA